MGHNKNVSLASNHMPQLDGLRAVALLMVLMHHLFLYWHGVGEMLGCLGVRLFFVLSGFLITGILLDADERAARRGSSKTQILQSFWVRRFLRIFPLYYLTVFVLAAFNVERIRGLLGWLLTYSSNYYMILSKDWAFPVSHFWSLAVEEQFYLVWPLVVLLCPRRWLGRFMMAVILAAPAFRVGSMFLGIDDFVHYFATPACLDSLVMGALLAYWQRRQRAANADPRIPLAGAWLLGSALCFVLVHRYLSTTPWLTTLETIASVFFVVLVAQASVGYRNIVGGFLRLPVMQYIGKLSYGVYIFHEIVRYFVRNFLVGQSWAGANTELKYRIVEPVLVLGISFLLAQASWTYLEEPINRYKSRFPYVPAKGSELRAPLRLGTARVKAAPHFGVNSVRP